MAQQFMGYSSLHGRLEAVASMVPHGSRLADIGSDHALLPRRLLASGQASHCIAGDIKAGGPEAAGIEFRQGEGLRVLRPEDRINVVTIAGMGARSIISILDDEYRVELSIRLAVLQPQRDAPALRRWLAGHQYPIVEEKLVLERGRYYFVMAAELRPREGTYSHPLLGFDDLLEAGPMLVRSGDPLVRQYWLRALRYQRSLPPQARSELPSRVLAALGELV
jgi:tRNA (adenine22-N1)-methyltransferase